MWSGQFTLTIITYVLHFLCNQQNIITIYKTRKDDFTILHFIKQGKYIYANKVISTSYNELTYNDKIMTVWGAKSK